MKKTITLLLFLIFYQFGFSIQVIRTLDKPFIASGDSIIVTLKISKAKENGIAKLLEEIPAGFRAELIYIGGGRLVHDLNGDLKIVWLTLPVKDDFIVQYRLIHIAKSKGRFFISGTFSFLNEGIKQDFNVLSSQIIVGDDTVLHQKEQKSKSIISSTPLISNVYTVQLGVFSFKKDETLFKGLPNVFYVQKEGKYRYCSGKFPNEKEAEINLSNAVLKGFKGAFVTKINND